MPLEGLLLRVPVGVREDLTALNVSRCEGEDTLCVLCICVRSVTQATATYLYLMAMGITEPPSSNACSGSEVCQDGVCAVYVPPTVWTAAMCVCKPLQ